MVNLVIRMESVHKNFDKEHLVSRTTVSYSEESSTVISHTLNTFSSETGFEPNYMDSSSLPIVDSLLADIQAIMLLKKAYSLFLLVIKVDR